jgi:hypothetical protein
MNSVQTYTICIVVIVALCVWLRPRSTEWINGRVKDVVTVKPLSSGPLYLIRYSHPGGESEYMSTICPKRKFRFKKIGEKILVHNE